MADSFLFDVVFTGLASAVFVGVLILHFLLFKEYRSQEKLQRIRLADLQKMVESELERSKKFAGNVDFLHVQRESTQDKLDLIKLQIEALKKGQKED